MGMYTEIHFRANLVRGVPKEITDLLELLITGDFDEEEPEHMALLPDHEFFECRRFRWIFNCSSAYFPDHPASFLKNDPITGWSIFVNADLKNYDGEIGKFFGWIQQYVAGHEGCLLGYELYEENDDPILYYKNEPSCWKFS
jgi:hypothetical protein